MNFDSLFSQQTDVTIPGVWGNVSLIILDKVAKALLCYHLRLVCWMISLAVIEEKGLENIEIYSQDDELQLIWCIKYPREYPNILSV